MEHDDEELVRRMAAGDREALAALYTTHAGALLQIALAIVRVRQEAEDLLHDVFCEAWHTASTYDPQRGRVKTWLAVRMRSRAVDRLRSARIRCDAGPGPLEAEVADTPDPVLDGPRLRAAIARLSDARRHAIELAFFEGLSCTDIARRLAIPIGTVKSRLAAGLRSMREALGPVCSPP